MMVIMSIIAVMLRKLISGSSFFRFISLRRTRLYVAIDAGLPRGSPWGGGAPGPVGCIFFGPFALSRQPEVDVGEEAARARPDSVLVGTALGAGFVPADGV